MQLAYWIIRSFSFGRDFRLVRVGSRWIHSNRIVHAQNIRCHIIADMVALTTTVAAMVTMNMGVVVMVMSLRAVVVPPSFNVFNNHVRHFTGGVALSG